MKRRWLAPFTPIYAAALALRNRRIENGSESTRRLRFPVISVGNLSTGGSGKTPLTIALAQMLTARGLRIDVLSRGYGRKSKHAARVRPDGSAEDFGDEPLLIARETGLPVYVAARRYDAGLLAEGEQSFADKGSGRVGQELEYRDFSPGIPLPQSTGALAPEVRVHLLDDGFQHRQLHRDVDVLLLNRRDWQDTLLPAGNLREPLAAIRRASVIAIPVDEPKLEDDLRSFGWQGPIWRLRRTMEVPAVDGPVVAFCGIARPEQFSAGLEAAGLKLALRRTFTDHHRYTARDLDRLIAAARAAGATAILTTEKDQVRLGSLASNFPATMPLKTTHLRIEIEDEAAAIDWLIDQISHSSATRTP
jgi:tetraacyldisaccharide 4'-kinase